jgi:rod shape-determining protein MreD
MIRTILWALGILTILLVLQTTVLSYFVLFGVKADLLLIVFVILATQNGSFASQIVGFVFGLAVDTVTTAPLGYHAFLFSLAGYLFGLGSGKVYFDPVVMPVLLGLLATAFELLGGFLLNAVFRLGQPLTAFFHVGALVQLLLNMLLSPVVFWLYGWLKDKFQDPRRGFGG